MCGRMNYFTKEYLVELGNQVQLPKLMTLPQFHPYENDISFFLCDTNFAMVKTKINNHDNTEKGKQRISTQHRLLRQTGNLRRDRGTRH